MEVQALRAWNPHSKATAQPISLQLGGEDGCCQNRQAVCTRTALSSLPWGPRHLSNQNRKTCDLIFVEAQPLLFIKPSCLFHIFLTCPCSDSRLDIVWFLANPKCVPPPFRASSVAAPAAWTLNVQLFFSFPLPHRLSSLVTSWDGLWPHRPK